MAPSLLRAAVAVLLALPLAYAGVGVGVRPGEGSAGRALAAIERIEFTDDGVRVARRRAIAASAPWRVTAHERLEVTGSVVVQRARRAVRLEERVGRHWRVRGRAATSRTGDFRFRLAAGRASVRVLRVVAPRARRLPAVRTGTLRVRVVAPASTTGPGPTETPTGDWDPAELPAPGEPAPQGSTSDWSFLFHDSSSRWDPCTVIRWAYNPSRGYAGSLADMKRAFARVAGRTGLHFRYVGTTSYVEGSGSAPRPAGVEITVGWASEREHDGLAGSTVGVGGGEARRVYGEDVAWRMERGFVVLDVDGVLRPGFADSGIATWGQVMQHEALHVLGLGHAQARTQLLAGTVSSYNHRFGAGDIAGMERIGADRGCL